MMRYLFQRSLRALITLWLVVTVVFLVFRLAGDPLTVLLPDDTPESIRAFYIERWGLNAPVSEQYIRYFVAVVQGSLGQSFVNGLPVTSIIGEALPGTLLLGGTAFIVAAVVGIGAGVTAAVHHRRWQDRLLTILSVMTYALPDYVLGVLLIIVFAVEMRLLPTSGNDTPAHLILPLATLSVGAAGRIARLTRSAVLDVLYEPYLRTARAKGLTERRVLWRHVLPNAAIPVITVLGFQIGLLVGGAAVVETVFGWPGVGRLFVSAVATRDLPVVQGVVLLIAIGVITSNLLVDITYGLIDPRIRIIGAQEPQR